ncbi:MAG: amidohydrolase [Candidatus Aminicenantes bacterium]|jgi:aminocarboxymuconate-semialdehyde decarboxylase|nr:amidohydrolase [Candidatus Aminicenantes bacterium]MDH5383620.1 amidohydrolase [Candidatus Aminicenantes bacterium]MDH5742934.1 amidohydrolase [Candidatus Aminicenantes bacterium]
MKIIDFHNHFYPPKYIQEIKAGPSNVLVNFDSDNNPLLHYPGDYNVVVRGHRDIDYRAEVLKNSGIDKQILTFTTPGTHIETPERSVELAQLVNDSFAKIMDERGDRFAALATLPLNDPEASVSELERAFNELSFKGVMLHSNINGIALSDQCFWPLYEKAHDLKAVFYIHPSFPVGVEAMTDYWLMPLVGFPFDTTLAAAKLVFSGVVEKFTGIRWVLGHLGGAIPYLVERLDRGYFAFEECRTNIRKPPSEYLKEFYYDTVNFDVKALEFAIDFAGADHFVAGSDYPHKIGSLEKMVSSIKKLDISPEEKTDIFGGNATKLLEL